MTSCERLSDLMPEVARGRATWTRTDTAHLAACDTCQDEWDLVRGAASHGTAIGMQVNIDRITGRVLQRLQQEPAAPVRQFPVRRLAWPIAIAAGLSLMIWGGPPRNPAPNPMPTTTVAVLHELDDLTPAELEAMLELVPETPVANYRTLETPESLSDLSAEELELLLSSMED
ncbi:MAG: hypothetical protein SGI84_02270 [Gemmatimonadota bacterium]|nr:hypothetical protein [Gemmatimonadota bacterium]